MFLIFFILGSIQSSSDYSNGNRSNRDHNSQNSKDSDDSDDVNTPQPTIKGQINLGRMTPRFRAVKTSNALLPERTPEPTPFPTQTPFPTMTPDYISKMNKLRPENKQISDYADIPPPTRTATPARTPLPTPMPTPKQTPRPTRTPKPTPVPTRSPRPIYRMKVKKNISQDLDFMNPQNYVEDYIEITTPNFTIPEGNESDYDITYETFPAPIETPEPVKTYNNAEMHFIDDNNMFHSNMDKKKMREERSKRTQQTPPNQTFSESEKRAQTGYIKAEIKVKNEEESALKKNNIEEAFHNFKTIRKVPLLQKKDLNETLPAKNIFNITKKAEEQASPCHRAARMVNEECKCFGGLIGDGITECVAPEPQITRVNPTVLNALSLNTIDVYYKSTDFTPQSAYCKVGKTVHLGRVISKGSIRCEVPAKNGGSSKVTISFDGSHWSSKSLEVKYDTKFMSIFRLVLKFLIYCFAGNAIVWSTVFLRYRYLSRIGLLKSKDVHEIINQTTAMIEEQEQL
ncbi:hypothetical protein TVAG_364370 [Trichomonas vaginalis G3]|uniref:IPT/TIG domain-containing protein n=1 Tax=Trichomonas vaginalis (strain ATCC PRA-98 / G3) TaxID=412133 RepID=A2E9E8_TRIV3|nr:immunoglobulins domain-containing protein [Trichomonas vaginalis G3]EAY10712.1 hypothetical protein TVAG_364370 [Trichomonas vaginalis G3]KAI5538605.1 immunoglobulins domain-containing protein [Trichomonas vaginalis G3]|eukprot:XP_001322935.1 hypothetical protein [Trichomonas vaginalis G3]